MSKDDHKNVHKEAIQRLQQAIKNIDTVTLPLEEEHYVNTFTYPEFKTKVEGFSGKIQSLLAALPGAGPDIQAAFKDQRDGHEWTTSLLDQTLSHIDDAVNDAKRVSTATKSDVTGTAKHAGDGKDNDQPKDVVAPVRGQVAPHIIKGDSFVHYMKSPLREKPQAKFADLVDNSNTPFVPNLRNLQSDINVGDAMDAIQQAHRGGISPGPHPLRERIDSLVARYPAHLLQPPVTPHEYKSFEETPFIYIDTLDQLEELATRLHAVKEIAVDLEAHSHRSFQGFCCLMQLSTREEDFIIDVIALRAHVGPHLAPIFADPAIVKIFHGADGDVVWLQRDFGIYICNLFDTGQALRVLNYSGHGLAHLLDAHCGFKADKRWQLADWRIRPLSPDALHYARADTHYLFHCYDRLRQELLSAGDTVPDHVAVHDAPREAPTGALGAVLERSRRISLNVYEKELIKEDSFLNLYAKLNKSFTDAQLSVFAALYRWRDEVARELDESIGYVLSRNQLQETSLGMPLTAYELSRTVGSRAEVVNRRSRQVLALIQAAKADHGKVAEMRRQWLQAKEQAAAHAMAVDRQHDQDQDLEQESVEPGEVMATSVDLPPHSPSVPALQQPSAGESDHPISALKPKGIKPLVIGGRSGGRLASLTGAGSSSAIGSVLGAVAFKNASAEDADTRHTFTTMQAVRASLALPYVPTPVEPGHGTSAVGGESTRDQEDLKAHEALDNGAPGAVPIDISQRDAVKTAMARLSEEQEQEDRAAGDGHHNVDGKDDDEDQQHSDDNDQGVDDFMPLPLSEKYRVKQSRKRRQQLGGWTAPAPPGADNSKRKGRMTIDDNGDEYKDADEDGGERKLDQTYKDLGLESDEDNGKDGSQAVTVDYAAASAKYDLGIVNPHAKGGKNKGRGRGGGRGAGRGRGGSRGRGRGKDDEPAGIPLGRFNPYGGVDLSGFKGGKRSAVHVRSGNRNSSFRK